MRLHNLPHGVFVGIAMSGGGSRAANFSAALLFELQELGVLPEYVSALSSVSGSSLTAGYYGLFGHDPGRWNSKTVRNLLLTNFEQRWIAAWFLPHNALRYWFTDFNRSHIMANVFDDVLFEDNQFSIMPLGGPRILLNGTVLGESGVRFVFTDESFRDIGSRLDSYPVSHAVMASGAFPAAFHSVTLGKRSAEMGQKNTVSGYVHLYDGGPADNLGITTLVEKFAPDLYDIEGIEPIRDNCFLFIFDAHTGYDNHQVRGEHKRNPRGPIDYFIDLNVLDASGVLLSKNRRTLLSRVGIKDPRSEPWGTSMIYSPTRQGIQLAECTAWVLTFERLWELAHRAPESHKPELNGLVERVNRIETRYKLTGPEGVEDCVLQNAIYDAAKVLVREDADGLARMCEWFRGQHIVLPGCLSGTPPSTPTKNSDSCSNPKPLGMNPPQKKANVSLVE